MTPVRDVVVLVITSLNFASVFMFVCSFFLQRDFILLVETMNVSKVTLFSTQVILRTFDDFKMYLFPHLVYLLFFRADRPVDREENRVRVGREMWERGHRLDSNPQMANHIGSVA